MGHRVPSFSFVPFTCEDFKYIKSLDGMTRISTVVEVTGRNNEKRVRRRLMDVFF